MDVHTLLFIKALKWKQSKCASVVEWIHMCSFFFFKICCLFVYFISGWVDLHCCPWDLSSCSEWGLLFVALHRLLIAVASFVVQALGCTGFSSCGFQALEHRLNSWVHGLSCMWDLPGPGIELVSPVLQGRLSTTGPPGRPLHMCS